MPRKISKSQELNKPLFKGKDYTGERFGNWTVVGFHRYVPKKTSGLYTWLCKCDCGLVKPVGMISIIYGTSTQCHECNNRKRRSIGNLNPNWKGYGEISGEVLNRIRHSCNRLSRTLTMDIDCQYLDELWKKQNGKCAYSGRMLELMKTASLDRIDSSKGYMKDNVEWVHVDCNRAKWELSKQQFISLCKEVTEHHKVD